MLVYHGSLSEIKKPDLNIGRFNLDFGKGFYVTTLKKQSEKWALRREAMAKFTSDDKIIKPIVNVYEFKALDLNMLTFDSYDEKWLDFVVENRKKNKSEFNEKYDVIYGNVADDDVARAIDDYLELLSKNRVNKDVKNALLFQLKFSKPNDQYCYVTNKGLNCVKFIESYEVEVSKNGK